MESIPEHKCKLTAEIQKRIREAVLITPPCRDLHGRRMSIAEGCESEAIKE
jgi:hypothetical protein